MLSHGRDASGAEVQLAAPPRRIVSLVPSVTEALFRLGLGDRLVGVTEWCIHPADGVAALAKVRGTKNPDLTAIAALAPDLVLANLEENREVDVRRMRERGLIVWVDFPRTVAESLDQMRWLAGLAGEDTAARESARALVDSLDSAFRAARRRAREPQAPPLRAFVAVWRDPWMTISADTYATDLLRLVGIEPIALEDAAPGGGTSGGSPSRYPRVDLTAIAAASPEVVLLPDEPYNFTDADVAELGHGALAATPAALHDAIRVIDGTLLFWHGPRLAAAIECLTDLVDALRTRSVEVR